VSCPAHHAPAALVDGRQRPRAGRRPRAVPL